MLGYLLDEQPGKRIPPVTERGEGWYDTGDIVHIDDEGFVRICGRAKRFAKVGGEMVSLTSVENFVAECWPGHMHAVTSIPDSSKGEQLVLLTEFDGAVRKDLLEHARANGISELAVPRRVLNVKKVPVLGTGKIDYPTVTAVAKGENNGAGSASSAA